jgi:membrane peptidoglycan carboxypeptidase
MSPVKRVVIRGSVGLAAGVPFAVAFVAWLLLPSRLPAKGRALPMHVREALSLESDGAAPQLVARAHLGILTTSGALPRERTIRRHLRELALASWLSVLWTRDELIDVYGATVWTGADRYGLDATARHLFGSPVDSLPPAQLALVIAMVRSPSRLDPECHPDRALDARNQFLARMRSASLLGETAAQAASAEPLGVHGLCEHGETPDNNGLKLTSAASLTRSALAA